MTQFYKTSCPGLYDGRGDGGVYRFLVLPEDTEGPEKFTFLEAWDDSVRKGSFVFSLEPLPSATAERQDFVRRVRDKANGKRGILWINSPGLCEDGNFLDFSADGKQLMKRFTLPLVDTMVAVVINGAAVHAGENGIEFAPPPYTSTKPAYISYIDSLDASSVYYAGISFGEDNPGRLKLCRSVKKGTFVAKIPGIMQRAKIGVQRAKLLDGASSESLDAGTDNLIFIISYLDGLLIERPSWFNWDDIEDLAELRVLYDEVSEWERNFRSEIIKTTNA